MGAILEVKYFNTFILKKICNASELPLYNGSRGVPSSVNGGFPVLPLLTENSFNWILEESRIRGGYNNTTVDFGAKAYIVEDEPRATRRFNALIYSGIFNSRTGINRTNVFSVAEDITKATDPANGGIQKLYAEDTNLNILQELKCSRALIDKDAIFTAEGSSAVTASNVVIGTIQPYPGKYGISTNPESFAVYGFNKYFSDTNNSAILKLSGGSIIPISEYGMKTFFRQELSRVNNIQGVGKIIGGYDIYSKEYLISLQGANSFKTLNFDEKAQGWVSLFSYEPDQVFSLRNNFYSVKSIGGTGIAAPSITTDISLSDFKGFIEKHSSVAGDGVTNGTKVVSFDESTGALVVDQAVNITSSSELTFGSVAKLWRHYSNSVNRGNFYGVDNETSITFIFNPNSTNSKNFFTIGYEGSNGWQVDSFVSDLTGQNTQNNINWSSTQDSNSLISSYYEGEYVVTQGTSIVASNSIANEIIIDLGASTGVMRVGDIVNGPNIPSATTITAIDNSQQTITISTNVFASTGDELTFTGIVTRPNYSAVPGAVTPTSERYYAGFNRKENKYVANLLNNSLPSSGEIIFGDQMSGIKGFYGEVKMSTDAKTDPGGLKTLFSVESVYQMNNGY